ncbi:MAG: DUF2865 domain-containing protein [Hyphomicrobiaceae bacterium]
MWFSTLLDNQSAFARSVRFAAALLAYTAAVSLVLGLAVYGAVRIADVLAPGVPHLLTTEVDGQGQAAGTGGAASSKVLADDRWDSAISSETFWNGRRSRPAAERSGRRERDGDSWWDRTDRRDRSGWSDDWSDDEDDEEYRSPRITATYRTVCVRLCDGYYFPISFATSADNLQRDAETCSKRCSGARLFYQRDPEDIESMVDLSGAAYKKLKNAFLYRTRYDAACKCKPHPWEPASLIRHRRYALQERIRKGDRTAVAELKALNGEGATVKPDGAIGQPIPVAGRPEKPAPAATAEVSQRPPGSAAPNARSQPEVNETVKETGEARSAARTNPPAEAKPASDRADAEDDEEAAPSRARSRRERPRFASRNSEAVMRLGGSHASGASRSPAPSRSDSSDWVQRAFQQH